MVFLVEMMTEISCYLQLALVYRQALALSKTDASYVTGNFSSHMLTSYRECLIAQLKNTDFSWSAVNRDRSARGAFLITIAFSRVYILKLRPNCRRRLLAMLRRRSRTIFFVEVRQKWLDTLRRSMDEPTKRSIQRREVNVEIIAHARLIFVGWYAITL